MSDASKPFAALILTIPYFLNRGNEIANILLKKKIIILLFV